MFPKIKGLSESDIKEHIDNLLEQLSKNYTNADVATVIESLTNYLSYQTQDKVVALQKEVGEQTREIIKLNRRLVIFTGVLAGATIILAVATFVLAYVTWAKP